MAVKPHLLHEAPTSRRRRQAGDPRFRSSAWRTSFAMPRRRTLPTCGPLTVRNAEHWYRSRAPYCVLGSPTYPTNRLRRNQAHARLEPSTTADDDDTCSLRELASFLRCPSTAAQIEVGCRSFLECSAGVPARLGAAIGLPW